MSIRGKRGKKKEKFFRNFILLLVLIFLVFNLFKIPVFHTVGLSVSKYFLLGRDVIFSPFANMKEHLNSKSVLIEEKEILKKEILELRIKLLTSDILEEEYKKLLSFTEDGNEKTLAKVILRPPYSPFDTLVLSGDFGEVNC